MFRETLPKSHFVINKSDKKGAAEEEKKEQINSIDFSHLSSIDEDERINPLDDDDQGKQISKRKKNGLKAGQSNI